MFDAVVVAHRRVFVQFPARPGAGFAGTDLGDTVQRVWALVFSVPPVFSWPVLLLEGMSSAGTAAAVPRSASALPGKEAGEDAACCCCGRLSQQASSVPVRGKRWEGKK
jgi:hypothetical protein